MKQLSVQVFIALILLSACGKKLQPGKYDTIQYTISGGDSVETDSLLHSSLLIYRDSLTRSMSAPVIWSSAAMTKGLPESALGNFVADACMNVATQYCNQMNIAPPDFAMFNNGGLRAALPAGIITRGNIYELMPFENELVILQLNDSMLQQVVNYIASRNGNPVSGIRLQLSDSSKTMITFTSKMPDSREGYRMLTSDYLANGGDKMEFLSSLKQEPLRIKIRDALFLELEKMNASGDTLKPMTDGRITRH
jgi:2',3'-cyclic-nucleotide 2'-phosphodiesterase (5'-nucleotidase family)